MCIYIYILLIIRRFSPKKIFPQLFAHVFFGAVFFKPRCRSTSPGRAVLWRGHETRGSSLAVSADLRDSAGGSNRELRDLAELLDLDKLGKISRFVVVVFFF